jgi:carbamoyl-phosphate synthase large subunit
LAEHFIQQGLGRGIKIEVLSYELSLHVPIAKVARVIQGLRWKDPGILEDLDRVISDLDIDCVIPFVDPAIEISAQLALRHSNLFVPVSTAEMARRFHDKVVADEWFRLQGMSVPISDGSTFPQIAKPRRGSASQGLHVLKNAGELETFLKAHERSDYLVQRFIDGPEYTVDCYVSMKGEVLSVVPRTRLETSSGESTVSKTCRHLQIDATCRRLLAAPGFRGPITIQFIEDSHDGSVYLMEINPRFGGACLCSIHSGADSVGLMLDDWNLKSPSPISKWKEGFVMTRAYQEVYFHADNH